MRDLLTVLAGLLILVLTAALVVPPFVDWGQHRGLVEAAIRRASDLDVRTEGPIEVRLLPTPRIHIRRMQLGDLSPAGASLDAAFVRAEIAPTALLHGEIRFLDTRIGRAEIKLPTGVDGDWRIPAALVPAASSGRRWVFDNLAIAQLLVTTTEPRTGRTDQIYAEGAHLQGASLAGPWRLDGTIAGTPFDLATGAFGREAATAIKIAGGGGGRPRFNLDARLTLAPGTDGTLVPNLEGTGRITVGQDKPQGDATQPVTANLQAAFRLAGQALELKDVAVEAGEGVSAVRLAGTGQISLDRPHLALTLAGRRLDLDRWVAGKDAEPTERLRGWLLAGRWPVDLSLKLDSVAFKGEDLANVQLGASLHDHRVTLDRLSLDGPGGTKLAVRGDVGLAPSDTTSLHVDLSTASSDGVARELADWGFGDFKGFLDGRPLDLSADVAVATPVVSIPKLSIRLGDATLTGAMRHNAAEGGRRERVDAQLVLRGLDLATLSRAAPLFDAARSVDLGLTLDARDVAYGTSRGGRVAARIVSAGPSLVVDRLEITGLAGAAANISGHIAPDGSGRIEGRLTAKSAAPLIDLVGRPWLGGLAALVPPFLRNSDVDLAVTAERVGVAGGLAPTLRTSLKGSVGKGPFEAEILSAGGVTRQLSVKASTDRTSNWFPAASGLSRPSRVEVSGRRDGSGPLALEIGGDLAGLRVATTRSFLLADGDAAIDGGEADLSSDDASNLATAFGLGGPSVARPVLLALHVRLERASVPRILVSGTVSGDKVEADLSGPSLSHIEGSATLGRLSLPWLAAGLVLHPAPAKSSGLWSSARFGSPTGVLPFGGTVRVAATSLDLGAGFDGQDGRFTLASDADGFSVRDLAVGLLGGRLKGSFTISRDGGLASLVGQGTVDGLPLDRLFPGSGVAGRLSAAMNVGGSGESVAGLVANLGGAGSVEADTLTVPRADAGGVSRAAARALKGDDPLATGRLAKLVAEEIDRGAFMPAKAGAPATVVGGGLTVTPLKLESAAGTWQGVASLDLKTMAASARGTLAASSSPPHWSGGLPSIVLGWAGPLSRPERAIDVGPLLGTMASLVLQRELDHIETFELDRAERGRFNGRVEMDRQRRADQAEEARQARLREQEAAERARAEAERARVEAEQRARAAATVPSGQKPAPLDIRPPAQAAPVSPGG